MIRSVIVEDETNNRELLRNMLVNFCKNVEVVGEADNVIDGVALIRRTQPELVFLDIEMPGGNGFDLLDSLGDQTFTVIFVTGYDMYAIKAIKYSALDYLLKPVGLNDLRMAILKAEIQGITKRSHLQFLKESMNDRSKKLMQLVLPGNQDHTIIDLNSVSYLQAQGNYVQFHLVDHSTNLVSYPLSHYEQMLPKNQFFRIHKSTIVNLEEVEKFESGRTGKVILKSGQALDIAARRKAAFVQFMHAR